MTLLSHEVEVYGVEDNFGLRGMSPHGFQMPVCNISARDDRELELAPVSSEVIFDRGIVWRMDHPDSRALQVFEIGSKHRHVIGDQCNVVPSAHDRSDDLHYPE